MCQHAKELGLLVLSKSSRNSLFIFGGFGNWAKALKHFKEHENSSMHKEALVKLAAVKSTPISVRLNSQLASDQSLHRDVNEGY